MEEVAMFGAGCFWHVELEFSKVKGISSTMVGYSGGQIKNPSYEQVSSHITGHAEVVQVRYDPKEVSYERLLKVFWKIHDPTQFNRQGPDVGNNYRSAIFYYSDEQKKQAEKSLKKEQKKLDKPITTEIKKAGEFYPAESYHQKYLAKRGANTCKI